MSEVPLYTLEFSIEGKKHSVVVTRPVAVLGRAPTSDVVVKDNRVSRQHAKILRADSAFYVEDMGSANGTYVNGRQVLKEVIRTGDVVSLGDIDLRFVERKPEPLHRVEFEEGAASSNRNVTAAISMEELSAKISEVSESGLGERSVAPDARAIALFAQAAEALLSSDNLDEVLQKMLDLIFKTLPAERGVIALYDPDRDHVEPRVMQTRKQSDRETIGISRSISNEVIRQRRALLVKDTRSDANFSNEQSILELNIRSAMCAPLYNEGRVSGLVYVDSRGLLAPFDESHLEILTALAVLSAVGVEQTRLHEKIEREKTIRSRLERYSSPAVVDKIVEEGGADESMIAEERDASILFADLSGFTSLSERMTPVEVAQLLNLIFERLTNVIFKYEGTLDKYMGDAIMAIFGAPLNMDDHAERATRAALDMQKALDGLNRELALKTPVAMRIGINSGPVVAGDIGSPTRKDYTVIGDVVNVASRLESSVAKPGEVVVGPRVHEAVSDRFEFQPIGEVPLKGKAQLVSAYRVIRPL